MIDLAAGDAPYRDDRGTADPLVAAALAAYLIAAGDEHAVLVALAASRLLVPVMAVLADEPSRPAGAAAGSRAGNDTTRPDGSASLAGNGQEKDSEMAMPALLGRDGRRALPAFTCLDALRRWQPAARPVPVPAARVFQAAVQDSCAVVIDVAGPVPLAVDGARLAALAAGRLVPRMHEDPDIWQDVAAAAGRVAPGIRVRLAAPQAGLDFTLELAPPAGVSELVPEDLATRVADAVQAQLADRVRLGLAVQRVPG